MSKKKGEGLKSFNRGFNVPDTYIIIFFVVVIAAVMTFLVPKGFLFKYSESQTLAGKKIHCRPSENTAQDTLRHQPTGRITQQTY